MKILFSNREFVVAVKPVGLDSEQEFPDVLKETIGGELFAVHRLDKNVGGVMVYARTQKCAADLSRAVQNGEMVKEYLALVHGNTPPEGDWEDLLWKDSAKNKVFVVKRERKGVKNARLTFRTIRAGEESLVHVRLYTGRSHQIRVQFSSRGFPLVGDHKYGSRDEATAPMLWSYRITFPYKGETKIFEERPDWA